MKITEDYVSFETAKLLKEKEFNEHCYTCYLNKELSHYDYLSNNFELIDNAISAPTHQMACRWLRDVHNIHIGINPISGEGYNATIYDVADFDDYGIISDTEFFFHPEEAIEAALKYVLENLI